MSPNPGGPILDKSTSVKNLYNTAMAPKPILIVDDDKDVRSALAELLEGEGYAVAGAHNGHEALQLMRAGLHPAVILLDLMMPVMDGWDFRSEQQRDPAFAGVPVVI